MSGWIRVLAAAAAFIVVAVIGILVLDFGESGASSWAYLTLGALGVAFIVYAAVEYAQTRRLDSITSQFDTRTLVLIPIAIALNIILGQAVAAALKIPIYLDSIGTILVGALAGPIPGALTGLLANTLWTFVLPPPFHSDFAAPFAVVAVVIGLLAGAFGRFGWLRPRPTDDTTHLAADASLAIVTVLSLAALTYVGWRASGGTDAITVGDFELILAAALALIVLATVIGLGAFLLIRRDLTVPHVIVAGGITGVIAAVLSAPIAANLFGGVTGAGTDFLVAAFRQAGADIQSATLGQGLISDPIDKIITFAAVYVILGAMATRTKARFPQGERLINVEPEDS